jgi:predicted ATPase
VTVCIAYIYSIPVFFWVHDLDMAAKYIERLIVHSEKYSLAPYNAVGLALKGELLIQHGDASQGIAVLRSALAVLQADRHNILTTVFSRALAEGLARRGLLEEARGVIDGAVALARDRGAAFDLADVLRAKAEIMLLGSQTNPAAAEMILWEAVEVARQQSAIAWELKAALVLAHLWVRQGQAIRARTMLAALRQQFAAGVEMRELEAADALLTELASA